MLDALPDWGEIFRLAPIAFIVCALIYFGWWLRGDTVKTLKEWIDELLKRK